MTTDRTLERSTKRSEKRGGLSPMCGNYISISWKWQRPSTVPNDGVWGRYEWGEQQKVVTWILITAINQSTTGKQNVLKTEAHKELPEQMDM